MIIVILCVVLNAAMSSSYKYLPEEPVPRHSRNTAYSIKSIKIYEAPHHVLVVFGRRYCSGSLISSRVVVTAASCFRRRGSEEVFVKAGISTLIEFGSLIKVLAIKIHEYYQHLCQLDNDIALLFLKNHFNLYERTKKILLAPLDTALRDNIPVNVLSWGSTNVNSRFVNRIIQSQMYVINTEECEPYYGDNISTDCNYCVRYRGNHISDNGGSVTYNNLLVGIVSAKATLKKSPQIAIITNVSFFYGWIMTNTLEFISMDCLENSVYQEYQKTILDTIY